MSPDAPEKQSKYNVFATLDLSLFLEAVVPHVRQDDVIDHVDSHQDPGRRQPARQLDVVLARLRISGRVIVKQHERRRAGGRRRAEHLARMDDAGIERADRQHERPEHPVLRVEQHDAELLDRAVAILRRGLASSLAGVYFIAFSSNDRIVTISDAVRVWDVVAGKELRTITTGALNGLALLGWRCRELLDGTQLARVTNEEESQVRFYDLATGSETRAVKLPVDGSREIESATLEFTPDGHLLVSGIVDKRVKLWDVTNRATERDLGSTAQDLSLLKFSRDARLLSLSEGYTVKLWDVTTGHELPTLVAPNSGLFSMTGRVFAGFSDDGKKIATGGFDTPTILWETDTAKQLLKLSGRTNMAYKVAFSADGNQLSSGGRTRWDLRTGQGLRLTAAPTDKQFSFPSPDGRLLATFAPNSNTLSILETPSGRKLQSLTPATSELVVHSASFSPDGSLLLGIYTASEAQVKQAPQSGQFLSNQNVVRIWDVKNGRELRTLTPGSSPSEAGFSVDGRVIATLGTMGEISLWDTASGSKLRDLTASPMAGITQMMNGMGGMTPGQLKNMKPGKPGSMPQMPDMSAISGMMTNMMGSMSAGTMGRSVTSLAFSPDGRTLAIGGVESKSNLDFAAMMNPAAQKNREELETTRP